MMRALREQQWRNKMVKGRARWLMNTWAYFALHPRLYRFAAGFALPVLRLMRGKNNRIQSIPFSQAWTKTRDLTAPENRSFIAQWQAGVRR
jgi:L-lactate dehydrogenase complex protein LldF